MKNLFRENRVVWDAIDNPVQKRAEELRLETEAKKAEEDRLGYVRQAESEAERAGNEAAERVREQRATLRSDIEKGKGAIYEKLITAIDGREIQVYAPNTEDQLKKILHEQIQTFLTVNNKDILGAMSQFSSVNTFDEAMADFRDLSDVFADVREDVVALSDVFIEDVFSALRKNPDWGKSLSSSGNILYFKVGYDEFDGLKVALRTEQEGVSMSTEKPLLFSVPALIPGATDGVVVESTDTTTGTPAVAGTAVESTDTTTRTPAVAGTAQAATEVVPAATETAPAAKEVTATNADLDARATAIAETGGLLGIVTGFFMPPRTETDTDETYLAKKRDAVKKALTGKDHFLGFILGIAGIAGAKSSMSVIRDMVPASYRGTFDQSVAKAEEVVGGHFSETNGDIETRIQKLVLKNLVNADNSSVTVKEEAKFNVSEWVPAGKNLVITVPSTTNVNFTDNVRIINGNVQLVSGIQQPASGTLKLTIPSGARIPSGSTFGIGVTYSYEDVVSAPGNVGAQSAPVQQAPEKPGVVSSTPAVNSGGAVVNNEAPSQANDAGAGTGAAATGGTGA